MRGGKLLQEEPSEQAREHAYGEEEAGPAGDPALAIKRDAAARHNHVDMRMVGERRAPGVEDGERGDAPVLSEVVETPQSQDRTHRPATPLVMPLAAAPYRASGLVQWPIPEMTAAGRRVRFLGRTCRGAPMALGACR